MKKIQQNSVKVQSKLAKDIVLNKAKILKTIGIAKILATIIHIFLHFYEHFNGQISLAAAFAGVGAAWLELKNPESVIEPTQRQVVPVVILLFGVIQLLCSLYSSAIGIVFNVTLSILLVVEIIFVWIVNKRPEQFKAHLEDSENNDNDENDDNDDNDENDEKDLEEVSSLEDTIRNSKEKKEESDSETEENNKSEIKKKAKDSTVNVLYKILHLMLSCEYICAGGYDATQNPMIHPTNYGADANGQVDSTDALSRGSPNATLAHGTKDLGGATINLGGGDYYISQPIVIPNLYGNMRIIDGTLRATSSFPSNRYLMELGDSSSCSNGQGSCNENFGFENLMLSCEYVCAGGIKVDVTMGVVIGPQMFFYAFNTAGVTLNGGHETMIFESWFGEFLYGSSNKENGTASVATGMQLFGNDMYVTNSIVFSSKIGVHIKNPASILTGVHTWNLATGNGGTGILCETYQTRILGCYADYNDFILTGPIEHISIQDGFFLGGGTVLLRATEGKTNSINGLSIQDNQIDGSGPPFIQLDESSAKWDSSIVNTVIDDNMAQGMAILTTKASKSLHQSDATQWTFDFSDVLLFPNNQIVSVYYSFEFDSNANIVSHGSRPPSGTTVIIETSDSTSGTVYITVDQSSYKYSK